MSMIRTIVRAELSALGDTDVRVVMSTAAPARDGHVLEPAGCVLENYRLNPIMLWQHNPDFPVATADDIQVGPSGISARATFAPAGVSKTADEVRGLVKSGVVRAVSVGFEPIEMEPLDPNKPTGGQRITRWELLECSFVSVPADVGAQVTARMLRSALPHQEISTGKERAMAETGAGKTRTVKLTLKRDLYDVGCLASVLQDLGWVQDCAAWEKDCEGDASKVPTMLGEAMVSVGNALIAMTAEEVGEVLAQAGAVPPPTGDAIPAGDAPTEGDVTPEGQRAALWQRFAAGFSDAKTDVPAELSVLSGQIKACRTMLNEISTRVKPTMTAVNNVLQFRAAAQGEATPDADDPDTEKNDAEDKASDDKKSDADADDDATDGDEDSRAAADFATRRAVIKQLAIAP